MINVMHARQARFQPGHGRWPIRAGGDARMEGYQARPSVQRPEMGVVNVTDALNMRQKIGPDGLQGDILRRSFQQDVGALSRQRPRRAKDNKRDQH